MYLFYLSLFIVPLTMADPQIVTRSEWGAAAATSPTRFKNTPLPFVVIHHSSGRNSNNSTECKNIVKSIQNYHMNTRKWSDIGYNFLVCGDGKVYEGRGWNNVGAHVPKYNAKSIGICLLGDYNVGLPSKVQLDAVKEFIQFAKDKSHISANFQLLGHRQGKATICPGNALFAEIKSWPHFQPNPV